MRALTVALLTLVACSPTASDPMSRPTATVTAVSGLTEPNRAPTPIPAVVIEVLPDTKLARLRGELRCGFSDARGLLLAAAADVGRNAPIDALAALDGRAIALRGERPGGFDTMRSGGSFGGGGLRATVVLGEPRPTGHEGSVHDALLTVTPTGERPRVANGRWECGP